MEQLKALIERYGYNIKQYQDGIGIISFNTEMGFINTIVKTITAEKLPASMVEEIAQLLNGKIPKYYIKVRLYCNATISDEYYAYVGLNPNIDRIVLGDKERLEYVQTRFDDYEIEKLKPFLKCFGDSLRIERVENE